MNPPPTTASPTRPKPSAEQIRQAIERVDSFASAPRILGRAMLLLRDSQCAVEDVAVLIRSDPAMAADIIRIANSVFFRGQQPTRSVEEALQRMGFRESFRLLTIAVSRRITMHNLHYYCISAEDFWAESLFNGLFMAELARTTGAVRPEDAYTAGLLRYIGRLAINQSIDNLGGGVFWLGAETLTAWETANTGLTQAEAGATLLQRWQFPAELVTACAHQDHPAVLTPPNWIASALFFISSVLPQGFDEAFLPQLGPIADSDFLHPNNLTVPAIEEIFARVCNSYQTTQQSLD